MAQKRTKKQEFTLIEKFTEVINKLFSKITTENSPKVYQLLQSDKGEEILAEMIIKKMIQNNISASACIPHIEREL
jgi:hypothetical protein